MKNDLPVGASPKLGREIPIINPYDKFERKKGLNYKEYSDFSGICSLCNDQIIHCYKDINKDMIYEEFVERCKDCPYARNIHIYTKTYSTNRYPYFITQREEYEIDNPKSYVYFITDGEYVKIGVAKSVEKRLVELQVGNPRKLYILCQIPTKTDKMAYSLESFLHAQYECFSMNGEWFNILNYIAVEEFEKIFK